MLTSNPAALFVNMTYGTYPLVESSVSSQNVDIQANAGLLQKQHSDSHNITVETWIWQKRPFSFFQFIFAEWEILLNFLQEMYREQYDGHSQRILYFYTTYTSDLILYI